MQTPRLELVALTGIPLVEKGDDLTSIIIDAAEKSAFSFASGDVMVVAQKIVSKAEGRTVHLKDVQPGKAAEELALATDKEPPVVQLILDESRQVLRHRPGVIIVEHRLGYVMANAGIDRSNVGAPGGDEVLLLPLDPDLSARELRNELHARLGVELGVIIADSVGRAWRMGTTGMALGAAGVEALADLRGRRDMFGRELQVSEHAVADAIAAAAELLMGEADEATPVVVLRGLDEGTSGQNATVLLRPASDDMFR